LANLIEFPQIDENKFWSNIDKSGGPDSCWEWQAGKSTQGYGKYRLPIVGPQLAHRIAYYLTYKILPADLDVCHHCDNPPCCNPSHFFLGTNKDNLSDAARKGRFHQHQGADNYHAKFTNKQILEIRNQYKPRRVSVAKLSNLYHVHYQTIYRIIHRWTYQNI
jgi:hypothetical protein